MLPTPFLTNAFIVLAVLISSFLKIMLNFSLAKFYFLAICYSKTASDEIYEAMLKLSLQSIEDYAKWTYEGKAN